MKMKAKRKAEAAHSRASVALNSTGSRNPLGPKLSTLARNVKKHLPVFPLPGGLIKGMSLEDRVKSLEEHLSGVNQELRTVEQRLSSLEHLVQSCLASGLTTSSQSGTTLVAVADSQHRLTQETHSSVTTSQHGETKPKRTIVYHQNPWNEEDEDIPWEESDNIIDPDVELELKRTGKWAIFELERAADRKRRCAKLCRTGHRCDEIHDPTSPCPPCSVQLKNYRMACKHRMDVMCYQLNDSVSKCPGCSLGISNIWSSDDSSAENLLSLLEAGFSRLRGNH